jgi:hypothetical protein
VPGAVVISAADASVPGSDVPEACCEEDSAVAKESDAWLPDASLPSEVLPATLFKSDCLNWLQPKKTVKKITIKTSNRLDLKTFLNILFLFFFYLGQRL